jgi:hypothetical protein
MINPENKYILPKPPLVRTRHNTMPLNTTWSATHDDGYLTIDRPLVPLQDLLFARRMFLYAQAARCVSRSDFFTWSCGKYCDDYKYGTKGSILLGTFRDEASDMRGMVAMHPFRQEIIVGFRATEKLSDFQNFNLRMWGVRSELWQYSRGVTNDVTVHRGYNKAYGLVRNQFLPILKQAVAKYPRHKIVFVGHSMGGAIASIALMDVKLNLRIPDHHLSLHVFGTPPVGSVAFRKLFKGVNAFRYVNKDDWVTRVRNLAPSFLISPLYHVGREVYITRLDDRFPEHAYLCNEVYDENDDPECSKRETHWLLKATWQQSAPSHGFYMNAVSGVQHCEPSAVPVIWN